MTESRSADLFRPDKDFGKGIFLGDDPTILRLSPKERLMVSAWRHACPRPKEVSAKYGLEWTRQRYDECDFIFSSLIVKHAEANPELHRQLTTPAKRLAGEPIGVHESGAVPISHQTEMSPLSTPWGFALPRVFIEQAGRGANRSWERYDKAIDLLDEAIAQSTTPIELLARLSELVVTADADPMSVLSHIFEPGILEEENCRTMYNQIAEAVRQKAPTLWEQYNRLPQEEREKAGMIKNFPV